MKRSGPGASAGGAAKRRAKQTVSSGAANAGGGLVASSDIAAAAASRYDADAPEIRHHSGNNAKTDKKARASKKQAPGDNVSYPNPRNFAERLMGALELRIVPDMVWWVGDGKAVALHQRRLKKRPNQIQERFHAKDYSALIRNFNRWGFRRVSYYVDSLSEGVVTYQNCLFQQSQPHLVKHMRMDSDVQDVFERHQFLEESNSLAVAGPLNGEMQSAMSAEQQGNLDQKLPARTSNSSVPENQLLTDAYNGATTQNNSAGVPGLESSPQPVDQGALLSSLLSSLMHNGQATNPSGTQQHVSASQRFIPAQIKAAQALQTTQNNASQAEAANTLKEILQLFQNGNNTQQEQDQTVQPSWMHARNSTNFMSSQNQSVSSQMSNSGLIGSNVINNPQRQTVPNAATLVALMQTYLQQAQQQHSQPPQQQHQQRQGHPSQPLNPLVQGVPQQLQRNGRSPPPPQAYELQEMVRRMLQEQKNRPYYGPK